jgi:biopolymer transport protein TolR
MKITGTGNHRLQTSLSEINITPLVDVMLVLLIIFMVTAPMIKPSINVNLPTAETTSDPSPEGLVLTLSKDRYIYFEDQPVNIHLLGSRLKNYFANREQKVVFIKADQELSYGFIIEVMDLIKQSGVDTVGLIIKKETK